MVVLTVPIDESICHSVCNVLMKICGRFDEMPLRKGSGVTYPRSRASICLTISYSTICLNV